MWSIFKQDCSPRGNASSRTKLGTDAMSSGWRGEPPPRTPGAVGLPSPVRGSKSCARVRSGQGAYAAATGATERATAAGERCRLLSSARSTRRISASVLRLRRARGFGTIAKGRRRYKRPLSALVAHPPGSAGGSRGPPPGTGGPRLAGPKVPAACLCPRPCPSIQGWGSRHGMELAESLSRSSLVCH
jgi:hypothetical protein